MKELQVFASIRRRSFLCYARQEFRRRGKATEKLLIDECIEQARRAVYVLDKHNKMKTTGKYEFDSMFLPKDTGQDVKTYMEEIYDPAISRQQFAHIKDPTPDELGRARLGDPNMMINAKHALRQKIAGLNATLGKKENDTADLFRPPPPPRKQQKNKAT